MVDQHYKTAQRGTCTGVLAGRLQRSRTNRSRRLTKGRANRLNQDPRAAVNLPPPETLVKAPWPDQACSKGSPTITCQANCHVNEKPEKSLTPSSPGQTDSPSSCNQLACPKFPQTPGKGIVYAMGSSHKARGRSGIYRPRSSRKREPHVLRQHSLPLHHQQLSKSQQEARLNKDENTNELGNHAAKHPKPKGELCNREYSGDLLRGSAEHHSGSVALALFLPTRNTIENIEMFSKIKGSKENRTLGAFAGERIELTPLP